MSVDRNPLARILGIAVLLSVAVTPHAFAQTFKVASWNFDGGQGAVAVNGSSTPFTPGTCGQDAWGTGFITQNVLASLRDDPQVVALAASQLYTQASPCASPDAVTQALQWTAHSSENNGVVLLAKYGFKGAETANDVLLLTNSANTSDNGYVVHREVCLDAGCTKTVHVFAAHWYSSNSCTGCSYPAGTSEQSDYENQSVATVNRMALLAPGSLPRILAGDLNVWGENATCAGVQHNWGLANLVSNGYTDAYRTILPDVTQNPGFSAKLNRSGCPWDGYKRIDYSWFSSGLTAIAVSQLGIPSPSGSAAASDHTLLLTTYSLNGGIPPDTTPPSVSITQPASGQTLTGPISIQASAHDDVAVSRVDFRVDGNLLGSATTAPYAYSWNTATVPDGPHSLVATAYDSSGNHTDSTAVSITVSNPASGGFWLSPSAVNATATGTTLQKTGGCDLCQDAGAISSAQVTAAGGYIEFVPAWGARLVGGLGTDTTTNTDYTHINFAFSIWPGGSWEVRESGVYKTDGTWAAGDVFKVSIEGTVVKYYRNGVEVYSDSPTLSFPLVFDTTLMSAGASLSNARLVGSSNDVFWTNVSATASATGSTLQKVSGCADCFDAGAVSQQHVTSSTGSVTFNVSSGARLFAGLSSDFGTSTDWALINYALSFWPGGTVEIRESGTYRAETTWSPSDTFQVAVSGTTVNYYRNGTLIYTSPVPVSGALAARASIMTIGASISSVTIVQ